MRRPARNITSPNSSNIIYQLGHKTLKSDDRAQDMVCRLLTMRSRPTGEKLLVSEKVDLRRLAAGPVGAQLAAVHHSENWYDLSGRKNGAVKGMAF